MNKVSEARETLMLSINSTPLRLFVFFLHSLHPLRIQP